MITKQTWKKYIDFAFEAYENHNTYATNAEFGNDFYRQEGNVPAITHPLFAASLLLADRRLPQDLREKGYLILLLHDIIEDTDQPLPEWVDVEIKEGVEAMTYTEEEERNSEVLKSKIYQHPPFIKLLTLCDTISNMYEEHVSEAKRSKWKELVTNLTKLVEKEYGLTRVVVTAKAILQHTDW